ncbi:uncharacterized protein LOC142795289 isoform X3 [Rhipicephalus microplus]|uniref:uncharacterized protein LOC142767242 isoform X3 n=1 Tax=Rhipicephalus microplus TaxID=6941 RepID=UPI003F6C7001
MCTARALQTSEATSSACQPLRLVHATNKLSDSLCTSSGLCLMNSFGQTSFRRFRDP